VAEDLGGGPGAQHVRVVDAVGSGEDRVDQGQHLAASVAGSSSPALATAWSSSKPTTRTSGLWEDGIEKAPS
jgi:hypothetical protein